MIRKAPWQLGTYLNIFITYNFNDYLNKVCWNMITIYSFNQENFKQNCDKLQQKTKQTKRDMIFFEIRILNKIVINMNVLYFNFKQAIC